MIPNELLNTLASQLTQALPGASGAAKLAQEEIQNNVKILLSTALSKLDLVTREEFDAQTEVLHRTREMIEQLEKKVAELEQNKA
jgi:BMFP domain-containing protein YqiC